MSLAAAFKLTSDKLQSRDSPPDPELPCMRVGNEIIVKYRYRLINLVESLRKVPVVPAAVADNIEMVVKMFTPKKKDEL